MPDLVLHVRTWVPHRCAFAVDMRSGNNALRRTMWLAGAAAKYVVRSCLAASIVVLVHVTRDCVVLARFEFLRSATVVKWRRMCYVPRGVMRLSVIVCIYSRMRSTSTNNGLASSNVLMPASDHLTAASTIVRSLVTLKTRVSRTAQCLQTSSHTVPAAKPHSTAYLEVRERLATTR